MAVPKRQPFQEHIAELRRRITFVVVALVVGSGGGYAIHTQLIEWLRAPLHQRLYYTSPGGALQFTIQVCLLAGALLALPVAVYGLVRFIEPAVKRHVHTKGFGGWQTFKFITISYGLAIAGAAFAYWIVLPTALHFFAGFSTTDVQSMITADKYMSFVLNCIGIFAAVFQLPLLLTIIDRIYPLPPQKLRSWRKWVIVGSFAIAMVLPFAYDPFTQLLLAAPLIVLYELSIWIISWTHRKERRRRSTMVEPSHQSLPKTAPLAPARTSIVAAPPLVIAAPLVSAQAPTLDTIARPRTVFALDNTRRVQLG